ncbi:MAG: phosphotransferase [Myxococcota bacterium]|nr:phosphotransferase [Myxococcota bacterium]
MSQVNNAVGTIMEAGVLSAWGIEEAQVETLTSGHINQTYRISGAGEASILQKLNPIFGPEVHRDIDAITARLDSMGMVTPRLIPTKSGDLWCVGADGGIWRLQTFIRGETLASAPHARLCESAGELVAKFHGALHGWDYDFVHRRLGVHDTLAHIKTLEDAIAIHPEHRAHGEVASMATEALGRLKGLADLSTLPEHIVHGDLKLTNILFAEDGQAHALIDLDTLAPMPMAHELGDALRSWCNRSGEDAEASCFDMTFFEAALTGYVRGGGRRLSREECASIPVGVETICLELTVRFLADALNESYFGWDQAAFASASEHNLARARAQFQVADSFASQRSAAKRIVAHVF